MEINQYNWNKDDLEKRKAIIEDKGERIRKCLEYAIAKLSEYHNQGAKGLIVDDAMYDVYAKLDAALRTYTSYNDRVTKKIEAKINDLTPPVEERKSSSVPRRSI